MDIRKIKKIIDLINENDIDEIEIHEENESIRITSKQNVANLEQIRLASTQIVPAISSKQETVEEKIQEQVPKHLIKSPMVGTVYLASTPEAQNFVEVGQHVQAGDTLCLIEAMKMYNRIEADKPGKIVARLIENAQPVEYDQPLFEIA